MNELAGELGLSNNAVRTHLTALERDGLVHPSGTRPGPRKPHITYDPRRRRVDSSRGFTMLSSIISWRS